MLQYARHKSPYSLVVKVSSQCAVGPGFDSSETLRLTLLQQPLREQHYITVVSQAAVTQAKHSSILRLTAMGEQKWRIFRDFRNS